MIAVIAVIADIAVIGTVADLRLWSLKPSVSISKFEISEDRVSDDGDVGDDGDHGDSRVCPKPP